MNQEGDTSLKWIHHVTSMWTAKPFKIRDLSAVVFGKNDVGEILSKCEPYCEYSSGETDSISLMSIKNIQDFID